MDEADSALKEALRCAGSAQWSERVRAAELLVPFVGDQRAEVAMCSLLNDEQDTAPVEAVANALMTRRDDASLQFLVTAKAATTDWENGQYMYDAIWMARQSPSDIDELVGQLIRLAKGASTEVRAEIKTLAADLLKSHRGRPECGGPSGARS